MEGHHTSIKGKNNQDEISVLNIYAQNTGTITLLKRILLWLKSYTDPQTLIVGNINIPLSLKGMS